MLRGKMQLLTLITICMVRIILDFLYHMIKLAKVNILILLNLMLL